MDNWSAFLVFDREVDSFSCYDGELVDTDSKSAFKGQLISKDIFIDVYSIFFQKNWKILHKLDPEVH